MTPPEPSDLAAVRITDCEPVPPPNTGRYLFLGVHAETGQVFSALAALTYDATYGWTAHVLATTYQGDLTELAGYLALYAERMN